MGKLLTFILASFISISARATPAVSQAEAGIIHYDLNFRFDFPARKLFATASVNIVPTDTLNLLLYRLLTVRSVTDISGRNVPFTQRVSAFTDWEQLQVNAISIQTRNITQLRIEYDGYIEGYVETGMLYTKDHVDPNFTILRPDCFAYPVPGTTTWENDINTDLDWFDYKVTVTVPDSLTVVNGGQLISKDNNNKQTTYVYTNRKPAWRVDVTIGKYNLYKADQFVIYYFPEDTGRINATAQFVTGAFALFETWFGKISDQQYTIIEIPDNWGSQTDVTSILQEASAIKDEKHLYELYHEISHTWNPKALDPDPSRLESEGLAMFLQYLLMEKLNNDKGAVDRGADRALQKLKKQFEKNPSAPSTPISEYGTTRLTDLSYTKGMLFFYSLYKRMGEQRLIKGIATYFRKYPNGGTLKDFVACLDADKKLIDDWIWTSKSSEKIIACENAACLLEK